jgi:CubicO group peptidase (beta-lactamase class C family)
MAPRPDSQPKYPPRESKGGWRYLLGDNEIRAVAGLDGARLDALLQRQDHLYPDESSAIVIIRHGFLVREHYTYNVLIPTRFDIWSGTKSFTGAAWGLVLGDSRQGRLPSGRRLDLDSPAYEFIPEGYPLTDPRKERILVRHLLTMTSGIAGQSQGQQGMPTASDREPFEYALGRSPNRYGKWADQLVCEPGTVWGYSDPGFAHLALIFAHVTGKEMADVLHERVLGPIGIENLSWDVQGGSGFMGPHTNAHTGIHVSARELARFGYLMLHRGEWAGRQLLPAWWLEMATRSSQAINPRYGYTWWVNTTGVQWPDLPRDAYGLVGYRSNCCYIIPSLDLVLARVGSGPGKWDERELIEGFAAAVVDD